jgi:hypothetical protein
MVKLLETQRENDVAALQALIYIQFDINGVFM